MKKSFSVNAARVAAILLVLLALEYWAPALPDRGAAGILRLGVAQARGRNPLLWDGLWKAGNGYYENLIGDGEETADSQTLITRLLHGKLPETMTARQHQIYRAGGFLIWTPLPNLNFVDRREGPTVTNSFGLFDREHALAKPPGVRRVAILGDSLGRGWGVPLDQTFGTLLQDRLNTETGEQFEMMNFSVPGYRLPQIYDMAMVKAPQFHPDVYLVFLSDLSVTSRWGVQLSALVKSGDDLKYDFLRDIARQADLRKDDSGVEADWKLAPYRLAATREMLVRLKAHADQESAQLVVVLMPAGVDSYILQRHFAGIRESLQGTGIQVVDLLDTFNGINVESARLQWYDPHLNAYGHRLIAANLFRKLHEQPSLWTSFSGQPTSAAQRAANSP